LYCVVVEDEMTCTSPLIEVKWSMMDDSAWPVSSTSRTPAPTCDALVEK
jgi:hypothetical protein